MMIARLGLSFSLLLSSAAFATTSPPVTVPITITSGTGFYVDIASLGGACSDAYTNAQGLVITTPFCSISRARTAMQQTSTKIASIRAGTYNLSSATGCGGGVVGLDIISADAGETFSYYPPDGYNSAVLNGQWNGSTGAATLVCVEGGLSSQVTFNGLKFENAHDFLIYTNSAVTVENSEFTGCSFQGTVNGGAAVNIFNGPSSVITHNYIHDLACNGISLDTSTSSALSNITVSNNALINTCSNNVPPNDASGPADCGALYCFDTGATSSTGIQFTNNYVRDVYRQGGGGYGGAGVGLYYDNGCSSATATGNIFTGLMGILNEFHGGRNNTTKNNVFDLESSPGSTLTSCLGCTADIVFYLTSTSGNTSMSGNSFTNNIIVANSTAAAGEGYDSDSSAPANNLSVTNNGYHNYGSAGANAINHGAIDSGHAGPDTNAVFGDPLLTCWSGKVGDFGSSTAVNYPTQSANWGAAGFFGPPGFAVPTTGGTTPSWSPSC